MHAFITGRDGMGMRDLGTFSGDTYSEARGINDAGQVVGYSATAGDHHLHAFITDPNGMGMRDLGTLGGARRCVPGINDTGQVVGFSYTGGNHTNHAFITGPNGVGE